MVEITPGTYEENITKKLMLILDYIEFEKIYRLKDITFFYMSDFAEFEDQYEVKHTFF